MSLSWRHVLAARGWMEVMGLCDDRGMARLVMFGQVFPHGMLGVTLV